MIIMNEKKAIDDILSGKLDNYKISQIILMLAKYHVQIESLNDNDTKDLILSFLRTEIPKTNYLRWKNFIDKCIVSAKKYRIKEINKIGITQKEINTIKKFDNISIQKLMFTILVLAKFNYMCNGKTWVNVSLTELTSLSRISNNIESCDLMLHELYKQKLIEFNTKVDNNNFKVNFVDTEDEIIFEVTDLRELGYWWLKCCNEKFGVCKECGIIFRKSGRNHFFCKHHQGYIPAKLKIMNCVDCGREFEVSGNSRVVRCNCCQYDYRKLVSRKCMINNMNI